MTEGITTTQNIHVPVSGQTRGCCTRQAAHVHYVPKKPPVNAAGDVDVFDASNQPGMDLETGLLDAAVEQVPTVHEEIEIPDFVEGAEEALAEVLEAFDEVIEELEAELTEEDEDESETDK